MPLNAMVMTQDLNPAGDNLYWDEDLNSDFGSGLFPAKSNGEPDYCRFYKVDFWPTLPSDNLFWNVMAFAGNIEHDDMITEDSPFQNKRFFQLQ